VHVSSAEVVLKLNQFLIKFAMQYALNNKCLESIIEELRA